MAKFWNFVFFQAGWFACIIGAANNQVLWPVIACLLYLAIHIWRSEHSIAELKLILKALIFGVSADSLIANLGYLNFQDAWPSPYLSPFWMWTLWALVASTINGSLSWLRGKPLLGAALGAIAGPLSYEAGIRMGAGSWGVHGQLGGLIYLAIVWGAAIPLFFYWHRRHIGTSLEQDQ
ncbi:DUF2878 domain-containing protein [Polynucleobacter sp. MG-Unter2-18]|uniref:DUF2878 domain-containing protein n=1 Tax=Polynucleobacter sp. MG-Unter2-18 TaxID=2081052 RepID=UPI001BFEE5C7|nr:DUF2878 domain-containing protein [Polynucleobacter sp. MG-Unter2-18]QWD94335.1 DUF2878 domain-containing protein [Polynucleobacter sp. MG-Unter2-18]